MRDALYDLVRRIPKGKATSYGALGAAMDPPVSGFLVGRAMGVCPTDLPWWRVVAKDGSFPTNSRSPELAEQQITKLLKEKVLMHDLKVKPECMLTTDELIALS
jgi:methylated-DNA-protein-cysteine methyltransferase-like protein